MNIPKRTTILLAIGTILAILWVLALLASPFYIDLPKREEAKPTPVSDLTVDNLLKEMNEERAKVGVQPLVVDDRLNKSAQAKADEIERTGVFNHVSPDGKHGYSYIPEYTQDCTMYGESLAGDTSSQGAINDWLGSKPHKDAMLDARQDAVGFGISNGPGYKNVVAHFCQLP